MLLWAGWDGSGGLLPWALACFGLFGRVTGLMGVVVRLWLGLVMSILRGSLCEYESGFEAALWNF